MVVTSMTHAELIGEILEICGGYPQVAAFYIPDSRLVSRKGWPDLAIGGPGGWFFREVKTSFSQPTWQQREVGYLMTAAGLDWEIWRPADLANGRIRAAVARIAGI